ncbi:MAG: LptE family protein [Candidatus Omnitrophica bacterium]|nr:LptE family protein [Candidatus Omnitrophota bacterium]
MQNKRFLSFTLYAVCCILSTVFLSGCGYTTRSLIETKYRTIYITPFINKTNITNSTDAENKYRIYRPMIETDITQFVNNRFLFDGNLKPLKEESADLILKGELLDFRKDPLRYDNNDNVSEYRINLVVSISLWDRAANKLLWKEDDFIGDTTYFPTGNQAKTEDAAVTDALTDLSRRIVERAVEQW